MKASGSSECRPRRSVAEQGRAQRPTLQSGDPTRALAHSLSTAARVNTYDAMYIHCSQASDRPDTRQKLSKHTCRALLMKNNAKPLAAIMHRAIANKENVSWFPVNVKILFVLISYLYK